MSKKESRELKSPNQYYIDIALIFLNTVIAISILNLIAWFFLPEKEVDIVELVFQKHGRETIINAYPEKSEAEVIALIKETWSRPYIYKPFLQFGEAPFKGKMVNVDSIGFRHSKNQGQWPPKKNSYNIFVFGGSTTFGYGVADNETIPTFLQSFLQENFSAEINIYNFGQGHYYSGQERIFYDELLKNDFIPDMVIFIDGLNDFYFHNDKPYYTTNFKAAIRKDLGIRDIIPKIALGRLLLKIKSKFQNKKKIISNYEDQKISKEIIKRYLKNKSLIEASSEKFGVKTLFVWQPTPTYLYNQRFHTFAKTYDDYGQHNYSRYGYQYFNDLSHLEKSNKNFLWCADLQLGENRELYIDLVHYNSYFNQKIAKKIGESILERKIINQEQIQ